MITRISTTEAANKLIEELKNTHGELMFHQSGGCCDGSAPMCYPAGEFYLGNADVEIGHAHGVPFYMSASQFFLLGTYAFNLGCNPRHRWAIFA